MSEELKETMTVRELIDALSRYHGDLKVVVEDDAGGRIHRNWEINGVSVSHDKERIAINFNVTKRHGLLVGIYAVTCVLVALSLTSCRATGDVLPIDIMPEHTTQAAETSQTVNAGEGNAEVTNVAFTWINGAVWPAVCGSAGMLALWYWLGERRATAAAVRMMGEIAYCASEVGTGKHLQARIKRAGVVKTVGHKDVYDRTEQWINRKYKKEVK